MWHGGQEQGGDSNAGKNVWYFMTGGFLGGIKCQSGDPIEQLL